MTIHSTGVSVKIIERIFEFQGKSEKFELEDQGN